MDDGNTKLVAIVYPNLDTAEQALDALRRMEKKYLVDIADAAYVTKDKKGKVDVHQTGTTAAGGAAGGAIWGFLIGAIFLVPIFGMLLGASTGALAGAADSGIDDDFLKAIKNKLKPESSALFILVRAVTTDKVVPELSKFGGEVVETNLSKDVEERLKKELAKGRPGQQHISSL